MEAGSTSNLKIKNVDEQNPPYIKKSKIWGETVSQGGLSYNGHVFASGMEKNCKLFFCLMIKTMIKNAGRCLSRAAGSEKQSKKLKLITFLPFIRDNHTLLPI